MNILLFRYGSICEPDIIETFQKFSFTVDEITEFKENKNLSVVTSYFVYLCRQFTRINKLKKKKNYGNAYLV